MDHLNRAKGGRPRKYATAGALRRGIDSYFESISYLIAAKDADGNQIINNRGERAVQLKYATPPSAEALCMYLGISERTWWSYRESDWAREVCEEAELRIKAWRVEETSIRDRTQGLQFLLSNYSGMSNKTEVSVKPAISMEEKKRILDSLRQMEGDNDAEGSD